MVGLASVGITHVRWVIQRLVVGVNSKEEEGLAVVEVAEVDIKVVQVDGEDQLAPAAAEGLVILHQE